ncbi:uncharacterized protein [Rutidosis leptorrhynchoides]|uniref:uncharacterized protein n=1 Tax=Rutidosis leptorrhynchoides TaxID=125765 RepID=UPI003A99AEC4
MKEHEDDVMLSVEQTTVTIDDELVVSKAKTEGLSAEKDDMEDMIVDVVGDDDVDGQTVEEAAVSGETRVLSCEKVEMLVNDGGSTEDVVHENVVASGSNGVIDSKESTERGLTDEAVEEGVEKEDEIVDLSGIGESFDEVDWVVVEEGFAGKDEAVDVFGEGTGEVDVRNKEECVSTTIEVETTDDREIMDVDRVVIKKSGDENETLDSSVISEPLNAVDHGSEDVDVVALGNGLDDKDEGRVDPNMVCPDNATHVDSSEIGEVTTKDAQNVENGGGISDSKAAVESVIEESQTIEEKEETKSKNEVIVERHIESVQEENVVMDDKCSNGDVVLDSSKITESLNMVNSGSEGVNGETRIEGVVKHQEFSYVDADMEIGDDVGVDIDEVLGWKDETTVFDDVTNGCPEKDQDFKIDENFENVEPGLSAGHREENVKSQEPIVYARRAEVEVPLFDEPDLIKSPLSEDEHIEIETDSDENVEYMQEDEQNNVTEYSGRLFSLHQSRYFMPPKKEGEFAVSDLVWGKVRSHPWWPGQIMDPADASQKAMKYHKTGRYLVAYFGDHSFAWNDSTTLVPFRANFSQMVKQTNLESFKIAVESALDEVSRRVKLGLACSCVPKNIYKKIEYQVIENAGVRKKSSTRRGLEKSASVASFEPDKLVEYVKLLAQLPYEGDKLEVAMAKAQLSFYSRYKKLPEPSEFRCYGELLEDASIEQVDTNGEQLENKLIETGLYPNKEISLSDVTDDAPESGYDVIKKSKSSGYKKRKARDSISNGSVKRRNRVPDKAPVVSVSSVKPSFKIGEMIQRVASQLTGPPSKVDHGQQDGQDVDQVVGSTENFQEASVDQMLLQLHITAQNPMKDYVFLNTIIPFFYDWRASVFSKSLNKKKNSTVEKPVTIREIKASSENDPVDFEFDLEDINDSYWTDKIIIQNQPEDQILQDHQNGGLDHQIVSYDQDKPAKKSRQSNKKRASSKKHEKVEVKEESEVEKRRRENLATELVLKFTEGINFSSEVNLIKMFRRFGPLIESETEVDRQGGRARVVFKRCSDAEVAYSSAGKFNIFGSIDVSYELNYTPLVSYKPLPLGLVSVLQDPMDAS